VGEPRRPHHEGVSRARGNRNGRRRW
jgi:hypothetical protein